MYPSLIEFLSIILFLGCLWHSMRYQEHGFARQWFIAAYLFAIIREVIIQVLFPMYFYAPGMLRLGAAPALLTLLWGSLFYLAYVFASRLVAPTEWVRMGVLVFVITASLILPIEATAAQLGWWIYEDPAPTVFGGVPITAPLVWGGAAVIFYLFFDRISATRLPDRGRMYAMITFSPIIAALHLIFTLALAAVFG